MVSKLLTRLIDADHCTGLWLRDLGGQLTGPGVELYGIDVSRALFPSQESCVATGVDLRAHNVVQSFPSEWNWKDSFDVVHQRLLVWGVLVSEWQSVLNNYLEVLKPGGFVQLTEVTWIPREGFPGDRPVLQRMGRLQRWISEKNSMDIDLAYRLEDVLKQAGFDLVESVQYDLKYGSLGPEDWHVRTAEMASEVFVGMADRMNGKYDSVASRVPHASGTDASIQGSPFLVWPLRRKIFSIFSRT